MCAVPLSAMPDPAPDLDVLADKRALRAIPIHARPKPRLRGRLHQGAFVASIPAGLVLVLLAPDARSRIATAIYAITLCGLFGVSAAYHLGDWSPAAYARMRRLDHSMIYVLIAGTYTPFCLLVLQGTLAADGAWRDQPTSHVFSATGMTAKCPSKYEPQAVGTAGPTGTTTN